LEAYKLYITYIVRGKPYTYAIYVVDETREARIAYEKQRLIDLHHITEKDISVQGGLNL
jgi:hypothetical protein